MRKPVPFTFEERKGISGVLFIDGSFKWCGNAQHHELVEDLTFQEMTQLIYFSSHMFGDNCSFGGTITTSPIGFIKPSDAQMQFIKDHYEHLDFGQKIYADGFLLEGFWTDYFMIKNDMKCKMYMEDKSK